MYLNYKFNHPHEIAWADELSLEFCYKLYETFHIAVIKLGKYHALTDLILEYD